MKSQLFHLFCVHETFLKRENRNSIKIRLLNDNDLISCCGADKQPIRMLSVGMKGEENAEGHGRVWRGIRGMDGA